MELDLLPAGSASNARATEPLPPRYQIVRRLGRGGAGTVVLARDQRIDRPVAVKLLERAETRDLERFRREAALAARVRSRSIVQVHELDEWRGRPYIVMEYVDGGNLADRELSTRALVAVAHEVARALAQAHENGIVHRDIKPENILLDRASRAYVSDFGLACDALSPLAASASASGAITGTPWFMSPEQARGEDADARSDVFSLGATLYAKLAGRRPFEGTTLVDVLHAVLHDDPPRLQSIARNVPRDLAQVVMRCLEKDAARRFASMNELADALERCAARLDRNDDDGHPKRWIDRLARIWPQRHESRVIERSEPVLLDAATIDRFLYGESGHVHLLDALEGLDVNLVGARIERFPHTIFQIVEHMRFWQGIALARIRGESAKVPEHASDGWLAAAQPSSDESWRDSLDGLSAGLRELETFLPEALASCARDPLRSKRIRNNIQMVGSHNSYHLGQIVTLRRMLGLWPAPKGGDTW